MKIEKENCHKLHKELWNWLAETGDWEKMHWPGWDILEDTAVNYCFACEYTMLIEDSSKRSSPNCKVCPIDWGQQPYCDEYGTLFRKWDQEKDETKRKRLAKRIANRKWNRILHKGGKGL